MIELHRQNRLGPRSLHGMPCRPAVSFRVHQPLAALRRLSAGLALVLATALSSSAETELYTFGVQDQIRLKVFEWRPADNELFEWTALNDIFTVGPNGSLSLPFIGNVPASGQSIAALGADISGRLMSAMGLTNAPDVAIDIVSYRPIYVTGRVELPGAHQFRPGMTVVQALSLAGGVSTEASQADLDMRDLVGDRGTMNLLSLSELELKARRARLEAERDGLDAVIFPAELQEQAEDSAIGAVLDQEVEIFRARREAFASQIGAMESLASFLEKEIDSLNRQVELIERRVESVESDFDNIERLTEQGLTVSSRRSAVERELLQVQSDRLSAETSLLRARQEHSRIQLAIIERRSQRINEISVDLQEVNAELSGTQVRQETTLMLMAAGDFELSDSIGSFSTQMSLEPQITIIREGGLRLHAEETTRIRPGDTLVVRLAAQKDHLEEDLLTIQSQ